MEERGLESIFDALLATDLLVCFVLAIQPPPFVFSYTNSIQDVVTAVKRLFAQYICKIIVEFQQKRNEVREMKYELYDVYETEILDTGELLCTSDDMAEIRAAAKERIKDTDGECKLYVKEWLDK